MSPLKLNKKNKSIFKENRAEDIHDLRLVLLFLNKTQRIRTV